MSPVKDVHGGKEHFIPGKRNPGQLPSVSTRTEVRRATTGLTGKTLKNKELLHIPLDFTPKYFLLEVVCLSSG